MTALVVPVHLYCNAPQKALYNALKAPNHVICIFEARCGSSLITEHPATCHKRLHKRGHPQGRVGDSVRVSVEVHVVQGSANINTTLTM